MNESARRRRDVAERVDVRHHVVPKPSFVRRDRLEVDIVEVRAHLRDALRRESARRAPVRASASASQSCRQRPCRVAGDHNSTMALDA